jgi:hypothetical protein
VVAVRVVLVEVVRVAILVLVEQARLTLAAVVVVELTQLDQQVEQAALLLEVI